MNVVSICVVYVYMCICVLFVHVCMYGEQPVSVKAIKNSKKHICVKALYVEHS